MEQKLYQCWEKTFICQSWWPKFFLSCQFRSTLWILSLIGPTVWLLPTIAFAFDNKHYLCPLPRYQPNHVTAPERHFCLFSFGGSFLLTWNLPILHCLCSLTYSLGPIWSAISSRKHFLDFGLIHSIVSRVLSILPHVVRDFMFMPFIYEVLESRDHACYFSGTSHSLLPAQVFNWYSHWIKLNQIRCRGELWPSLSHLHQHVDASNQKKIYLTEFQVG